MYSYLITHGDREEDRYDPSHTKKGISQVGSLTLPIKPSIVVIGEGKRFYQIYQTLLTKGQIEDSAKICFSPFCGSPNCLLPNGNILIAGGMEIKPENHFGINKGYKHLAFEPWVFVNAFPPGALFCAGGEVVKALGYEKINKRGCLYRLILITCALTLVQEGK